MHAMKWEHPADYNGDEAMASGASRSNWPPTGARKGSQTAVAEALELYLKAQSDRKNAVRSALALQGP
jgi:hypothetical protein